MKKCFLLVLFSFAPLLPFNFSEFTTRKACSSYTLSKDTFKNSDEFLEYCKELSKEQRIKTINILEKSEHKDDLTIADLLKNRLFLDHIRVTFEKKYTYFQLINSKISGILLARTQRDYAFDKEKVDNDLHELFEKLPSLFTITIVANVSSKQRKERETLFQKICGPSLKDDLYSAAIEIKPQ
jgi:hypothetical protein